MVQRVSALMERGLPLITSIHTLLCTSLSAYGCHLRFASIVWPWRVLEQAASLLLPPLSSINAICSVFFFEQNYGRGRWSLHEKMEDEKRDRISNALVG